MISIVKNGDSYELVWDGGYGPEVVDEAETEEEAEYLAQEYRVAFGS